MVYIFHHTFPRSELLRTKDLTNDYIKSLTTNIGVDFDDTFDSLSAIDVASLNAADKLKKSLSSHGIDASVGLTRSYPHPSFDWILVIETEQKLAGIDCFVESYIAFSRMERHEILSYNEIIKTTNLATS